MYDGYLELGGIEILNRARTGAYLRQMLAGRVDVRREDAALRVGLGHGAYTTPSTSTAPWMVGARPAGGRFLGLFPGKITGGEDSTRTVEVTELSGDGAVMTSPRYASLEMRFLAVAYALDEEAMEEGMAWLRQSLSNDGCSDASMGCTGREAKVFAAMPATTSAAATHTRVFHRVETTEGPRVVTKYPVTDRGFVMWQVEFTLTAGIPWAFTALSETGTANMDTATAFQDPAGENCAVTADAYDNYVDDPFFTGIARPPRAPVILPPNIQNITSWRRKTLAIPSAQTLRWGRVVPVVHVSTVAAIQYLRLRFYQTGKTSCAFDGEFVISYIPKGAVLTLDAIKREATLRLSNGKIVPAGHLLFGSHGRPFLWPTLGCQHTYQMTADLLPGQTGVALILQTAVRN